VAVASDCNAPSVLGVPLLMVRRSVQSHSTP
jgi:hypothetical protein